MKNDALIVLALVACALITSAQEPRVTHTQFHSGPASLGLSATVDRFRHANAPLWLGYAVPALPRAHHSSCSFGTGSSEVEAGCCNELQLEDTNDLNTSASPALIVDVLLRLDHGEVTKTRVVPVGCALDAGGLPFEWLTDVHPEDSTAFLGKLAEKGSTVFRVHNGQPLKRYSAGIKDASHGNHARLRNLAVVKAEKHVDDGRRRSGGIQIVCCVLELKLIAASSFHS